MVAYSRLSLAFVLCGALSCTVDGSVIDDLPCECAQGFVCDETQNRCVREVRGDVDAAVVDENAIFMSPFGADGAAGTREAPLRTFSEAVSRLEPGSTLVLLAGRYSESSGTGLMDIDCREDSTSCAGAPCPSGTVGAPITVRADQERLAQLHAEPGDVNNMGAVLGCEHYRIEGLAFLGADVEGNPWQSLDVGRSSHVVVRRNLFQGSNRFVNSHLLLVSRSSDVVLEENELYDFHRAGISIYLAENVRARRNYANPRNHADLENGYVSSTPETGDASFSCSHSRECLYENNVADGFVGAAFSLGVSETSDQFSGEGDDAQYLGNLVFDARHGLLSSSACGGASDCNAIDELSIERPRIENNVFRNTESHGVFLRGVRDALVDHNTLIESSIRIDRVSANESLGTGVRLTNNSVIDAGSTAITVQSQETRFVGFNNSFGSGEDVSFDGGEEGIGMHTNVDPENGDCLHRNQDGSPLNTMGEAGSAIGATIVRRYEDGTLTDAPLWAADGSFPCGAVVPGINDTGPRCTNAHERFNVGTCPVE
ncbi:MAG: hypothetical protein AAF411_02905 [Myxococcota bacterium]